MERLKQAVAEAREALKLVLLAYGEEKLRQQYAYVLLEELDIIQQELLRATTHRIDYPQEVVLIVAKIRERLSNAGLGNP